MHFTKIILKFNDEEVEIPRGGSAFRDEFYAEYKVDILEKSFKRIRFDIHPKVPITINKIELIGSHPYDKDGSILCNGYQSWTETREFKYDEYIQPLRNLTKRFFIPYGDQSFVDYTQNPGELHSWTYTYIRNPDNKISFAGSLAEFTGFCLFKHFCPRHKINIEKDCPGLELDHSYPVFDILIGEESEKEVFDKYFDLLRCKQSPSKPILGWTSWYNHYTSITEEIILKNLEGIKKSKLPFEVFQIDDGYQKSVGDWLEFDKGFPNGVASICQQIRSNNLIPGIWLAPFVVEKKSTIFKNRPNWLLRDKNGKPVKAGYNPLWSGWFYALDFYNQDVKDYLNSVFFTYIEKFKFELLKLDFLYAAALCPPANKTRGQVMNEVMTFLRKAVGNKKILACGVQLGAAFGKTDYCRIGPDIHLKWEYGFLKFLRHRERPSTLLCLKNTIFRRHLNEMVFQNDPDVFILRDKNQRLNAAQKKLVMVINMLLGHVIFCSDDVSEYGKEQLEELTKVLDLKDRKVTNVFQKDSVFVVEFSLRELNKKAVLNLASKATSIVYKGNTHSLKPFECSITNED